MIFSKRNFGFRENLIAGLILLFAGIFFEFITNGMRFSLPFYPLNVILVLVFISSIIFLHIKYYNHWFILWFSNISSAIISIITITLLSLIPVIFLPHENANFEWYSFLNLAQVQNSLLFITLELYILTVLGFVTLRKCNFISLVEFGLFIFHFGLWIFLAAFIVGASDLKQGKINLLKDGYPIDIVKSTNGEISRLPFAVKLIDLKLISNETCIKICTDTINDSNNLTSDFNENLYQKKGVLLNDWYIQCTRYIDHAIAEGPGFKSFDENGNYPAVLIKVINVKTHVYTSGWLSTGSYLQKEKSLYIDNKIEIKLIYKECQAFNASLEILHENETSDTIKILTNHPMHLGGWTFSIIGYDKSKGRWSSLCILKAVKDPWIYLVYIGGVLMFLGISVYFIFTKKFKLLV